MLNRVTPPEYFVQEPPAYICPICNEPLQLLATAKTYSCPRQHSFDVAKEGYLNLLPVQHKHSKEPGDNKAMISSRRAFLEAGFYQPLADALAMLISANATLAEPVKVLDLGCGEGYYSRTLARHWRFPKPLLINGLDIAKVAVAAAAKKQPEARFVVASVNRLPYPAAYFDFITRVFAPSDAHELMRVLKQSGLLLLVTPGPRHLWQLKTYIYKDVQEHPAESPIPQGFQTVTSQAVSYPITPNAEQRMALLQMTPFAWQANEAVHLAISQAEDFTIDVDFVLTVARALTP